MKNSRLMLYAPLETPPAREQVVDENDKSYYQHYVDQASADMEAEAKKPEDDKNNEDGPKHDAFSLQKHGFIWASKLRAQQALSIRCRVR